jgi:hypothetical protein
MLTLEDGHRTNDAEVCLILGLLTPHQSANLRKPKERLFTPSAMFSPRKRKPSPAETESQFTAAEDQRQAEFNESMLEYEQRFMDEEKAQRQGEQSRTEEFDQMIVRQDDAFENILEKRDKAFQNEEARRRDLFQEQESLREKRFAEVESRRGAHFLQYQETIEKRAEWFAKIRESHLQRGRQEREEVCKKLEKDMQDQLERLLRWQEESFARAEKQRDEVVREVVSGFSAFCISHWQNALLT